MELAAIGIAALVAVSALLVSCLLARSDIASRSDDALLRLLHTHEKALAASGKVSLERHERALETLGRLRVEMKRRGLMDVDTFVNDGILTSRLERASLQSYSRSVRDIQRLASQGDPAALRQLGVLFGIAKESEVSLQFLAKAAEAGDAEGQFALALALFAGAEEQGPDKPGQSLMWLKIAADQGHARARIALAHVIKSMPTNLVLDAFRDARHGLSERGAGGGPLELIADAAGPSLSPVPVRERTRLLYSH